MLVYCYGEMLIVFMDLVNFFCFYHFIFIALNDHYAEVFLTRPMMITAY
jgi:hypothetical protein